jgi:hypothetical protein
MTSLDPKIQRLIHYYEEHLINDFFKKSFTWMIAYLFFLVFFFTYNLVEPLLPYKSHILNFSLNLGMVICAVFCYFRIIYLLEKTLGNLNDLSFKEKLGKCMKSLIYTQFTLRITEVSSVKEAQMKKVKEEFLDKENVNSKEKVLAFIEELERKLKYESERNFFGSSNFSWILTLFIPVWTVILKIFTEKNELGFQDLTFSYIMILILMSLFVVIAIHILFSFLKNTVRNVFIFHFPFTKHKIKFLIGILQEIHLYYCFKERTEK